MNFATSKIMLITKSKSNMFIKTLLNITYSIFSRMISSMFLLSSQLKILYSIIKLIFIFMMYNFIRFQKSTQVLFHNKSMFSHITQFNRMWMIGSINKFVTTSIKKSAVPRRTFTTYPTEFKSALSILFSYFRSSYIFTSWHRIIMPYFPYVIQGEN